MPLFYKRFFDKFISDLESVRDRFKGHLETAEDKLYNNYLQTEISKMEFLKINTECCRKFKLDLLKKILFLNSETQIDVLNKIIDHNRTKSDYYYGFIQRFNNLVPDDSEGEDLVVSSLEKIIMSEMSFFPTIDIDMVSQITSRILNTCHKITTNNLTFEQAKDEFRKNKYYNISKVYEDKLNDDIIKLLTILHEKTDGNLENSIGALGAQTMKKMEFNNTMIGEHMRNVPERDEPIRKALIEKIFISDGYLTYV